MDRIFKLTNARGESWDLMDLKNVALFDPQGLGMDLDNEYIQIGNSFLLTKSRQSQREIKANLIFSGTDAYAKYFKFVRFAMMAPLTLEYTADKTYFIIVELTSIEKTEKMSDKHMQCGIVFTARSLFRARTVARIKREESAGEYPYTYAFMYGAETPNSVVIESDATQDSPCRIRIFGPVTNPVWRHYVNGAEIETGAYTGTVPEGNVLVIDTTAIPYSIIEYDNMGNVVANRYQQCDFSTARFFMLQYGANRIAVSHDGVNNVEIEVEAVFEYETV